MKRICYCTTCKKHGFKDAYVGIPIKCNICSNMLYVSDVLEDEYKLKTEEEKEQVKQKIIDDAIKFENEEKERQRKAEERKNELLKREQEIIALNDIYEYDVDIIYDAYSGGVNLLDLKQSLQEHSKKGWRLISVSTNELGKNSAAVSVSGFGLGSNSTQDQTVLIFERKIELH